MVNRASVRSPLPLLPTGFGDVPFVAVILGVLYVISRQNYLLFHCLIESAIAGISFTALAFAWNSRRFEHGYLLLMGICAGFQGLFGVLHALVYQGMNIFLVGEGPNLAPQLWIASRYLQAAALLVAPVFLSRPLPLKSASALLTLISVALLAAIFTGHFPDCFQPGSGLTPFKVYSEYAVMLMFLVAGALLYRKRAVFPRLTVIFLLLYFAFAIATELMFTTYATMYDLGTVLGHFTLLLSTYAFYKAIVETGLRRPFDLLFRELNQAIQARDEFLSIASHELKTPLTPLKMQLQGLRRLLSPERMATLPAGHIEHTIDVCTKQIDRLTYLIDNLLDVSRISAGKLGLRRERIDVKSLWVEILARHEGEIRSAGVQVLPKFPAEPLVLDVDLLRIDQVLTNLFTNALKYAPGSNLELGAETEGLAALLWVQDSGPGIPRAAQAKVFERFERAQPSDKVTGLGLGLFISRQIVEAHGGTLRLKSEAGSGSRFEIRLPLN